MTEFQYIDWQDPGVFERSRQPGHATLISYDDIQQALVGRREASRYYHSLNGEWDFHWAPNPASAPDDFYKPDASLSDWDKIQVPGNWQKKRKIRNSRKSI